MGAAFCDVSSPSASNAESVGADEAQVEFKARIGCCEAGKYRWELRILSVVV
jgi:hypothetical protein